MRHSILLLCAFAFAASAQSPQADLSAILERLDRLERENRELRGEVRALQEKLGVVERVEVQEARTAELAQTKVQASARYPVQLTGTALFNAFWNGSFSGDSQYPVTAAATEGRGRAGGTLRQSILGFRFNGPEVAGGGKVSGSLYTDFFAGTGTALNQLVRLRVASVQVDWKNTTIMAGQEKPISAPREPLSIAQMGVSPLTQAGNLWLWLPQARIEQRFALGREAGLRAELGMIQTSETGTAVPTEFSNAVEAARPGYEGRFEFWKNIGANARVEFAPSFHLSSSHVAGTSVPSRIWSADWLVQPVSWFDFSGAFFSGSNVTVLGALRQGFVFANGRPRAVRSMGGWGQLAFRPTSRLSFHAFGGQQDDRNRDLLFGNVGKNLQFGANTMFRIAPNVVLSFEGSNIRTTYLGRGTRMVTHYDLAVAYQF